MPTSKPLAPLLAAALLLGGCASTSEDPPVAITGSVFAAPVAGARVELVASTHRSEPFQADLRTMQQELFGLAARALDAFAAEKAASRVVDADRSSIFIVDREKQQLWTKIAQGTGEIRIPLGTGIAGYVAQTGRTVNIADAYGDDRFNRSVDQTTGYRTRSLLCVPIKNASERPFAVMTLLNKKGRPEFSDEDERAAGELTTQLGVVLQTWHQAHRTRAALRT